MAGDAWILGIAPIIAHLVEIRVADTAVGDFKRDFAFSDLFPVEDDGDEILVLGLCSESVNFGGFFAHLLKIGLRSGKTGNYQALEETPPLGAGEAFAFHLHGENGHGAGGAVGDVLPEEEEGAGLEDGGVLSGALGEVLCHYVL